MSSGHALSSRIPAQVVAVYRQVTCPFPPNSVPAQEVCHFLGLCGTLQGSLRGQVLQPPLIGRIMTQLKRALQVRLASAPSECERSGLQGTTA